MPFKKTFSIIFSVLMSMSALSAPVWAEDEVQETDQTLSDGGPYFEEDVETIVPDVDFDNEEMLNGYLESLLYDDIETTDRVSFGLTYASSDKLAEGTLGSSALGLYRALKEKCTQIASGELTSTSFTVNASDYGIKKSYTAKELGIASVTGASSTELKNALKAKVVEELQINQVVTCLLNSNPYIMYWFDKTIGVSYGYSYSIAPISSAANSEYGVMTSTFSIKMYVAPGYMDYSDATRLTVDPSAVEIATEASNNAKQIVANHAGESDYAKILSYKDEVLNLTGYDYDAANIGTFDEYGTSDPWQLIWVFDGDPDTNVVCEGYSKAMKYLCDLSTFTSPQLECYLVTGLLGDGPHMWNILVMDDGNSYLADLTNSDEGTAGSSGGAFLNGAVEGSVEEGFVMRNFGQAFRFTYDDLTLSTTDYDILDISKADYTPVSAVNHVTFDGNGADSGSVEAVELTNGSGIVVPENGFTRRGYSFRGWNTASDGSGTGYSAGQTVNSLISTDSENVVLYAQWAPLASYTVTFDANGADSGTVEPISVYEDEELILPENSFAKEHATFVGWNTEPDGSGTSYQPGDNLGSISQEMTLYAVWQNAELYTVRFDWNYATSGSVDDVQVYDGETLTFPKNGFTKDYATFKGWSASMDGSEEIHAPGDSIDGIASDMVFYAQWEMNPTYIVNFDWNYANSGSVNDIVAYEGESFDLPENGFEKSHYTFGGWNTKMDGSGDSYPAGETIDGVDKNTTFYAQWNPVDEYNIRFDWNYANSGSVSDLKVYADESTTLPENGFTKDHAVFEGWNTKMDGAGKMYQPGDPAPSSKDMVLYAQWKVADSYTVHFDWNYANSGSVNDMTAYADEAFLAPENEFEKAHSTFAGWNTEMDGSGTSYNPGDEVAISENTTLYAQWQSAASYTVRFDWNYANSGTVSDLLAYEGEAFVLPENGFSKDNAKFAGWNTEMDGSGTSYKPGDEVEGICENTTFYAQWQESTSEPVCKDVVVVDREAYDEQVLVKEAYDETILVKEAWDEPYAYVIQCVQCGTEFPFQLGDQDSLESAVNAWDLHALATGCENNRDITKYIHHDAECQTVHHDAEYKTVHHDAVTHVEQVCN